jgi:hypothetical protein
LYNISSKLQNLQRQAPSSKSATNHQAQFKLQAPKVVLTIKLSSISENCTTPTPKIQNVQLMKLQAISLTMEQANKETKKRRDKTNKVWREKGE